MKNKEIIDKVMKGNSTDGNYNTLKNMFPQLFEEIGKDMLKVLSLKDEEVKKDIEELPCFLFGGEYKDMELINRKELLIKLKLKIPEGDDNK